MYYTTVLSFGIEYSLCILRGCINYCSSAALLQYDKIVIENVKKEKVMYP